MAADPDRVRLAAEALARVRADAWARGERPSGVPGGRAATPGSVGRAATRDAELPGGAMLAGGGASGARSRRDDPQPLTAAVGGLLSARGWRQRVAVGAVFGRWAEVVGPDLAAHTRPEAFEDGELVIAADSAAWATQVRLLAPQLLRRLGTELGAGTVHRVRVHGPGQRRHVR